MNNAGKRKRATNVSIDSELLDEARELGINLSQTFESHLEVVVRESRAERWKRENAEAIESYNARIARHGLFGDRRRRF